MKYRKIRRGGAAKQALRSGELLLECAKYTPEDLPEIACALTPLDYVSGIVIEHGVLTAAVLGARLLRGYEAVAC
ncbi:MAG: hypothetical protein ABSH46_20545 [Bryobacteraceae bacterium]|jgi:hypothetical protein